MLKGEEINKQLNNIYSFTKDKYGENNILNPKLFNIEI